MKSKKEICIERIAYLMSNRCTEILEEDKIYKILIKLLLDEFEYCLLNTWVLSKCNIKKTSELMGQTKIECENDINKVIHKVTPILWSYRNNPFINDIERRKLISKKKWIGDMAMDRFLNTDIMMMQVDEFIDIVSYK